MIVKLWPGKSERQKTHLAETITKDIMDIPHYGEESVSVAIEEVPGLGREGLIIYGCGRRSFPQHMRNLPHYFDLPPRCMPRPEEMGIDGV